MKKKTLYRCLVGIAVFVAMLVVISDPAVAISPNSYCRQYGFDGGCYYGHPASLELSCIGCDNDYCENDPCGVGANATYYHQSYGHHGAFACCYYLVESNASISWYGATTERHTKNLIEPLLVLLLSLLLISYLLYKKHPSDKTPTHSG